MERRVGHALVAVAIEKMIPELGGVCGGACACSTCHVFVDEAWLAKTGEKDDMETSMLEFAEGIEANSRLACQIKATAELDGIVVRLPESQH